MASKEYKLVKPVNEIPIEEQIDKIWKKPLSRLPVYKDLPRLAGRISIESIINPNIQKKRTSIHTPTITTTNNNNNNLGNNTEKTEKKRSKCLSLKLSQYFDEKDKLEVDKLEVQPDENNDTKVWKRTKNVIYQLSELFNSTDETNSIRNILEATKQPSEYELTLESIFKVWFNGNMDALENNKAIKILKLVHQNIIYVGCYEIKMKVPFLLTHLTKDVRGIDGWKIRIFEGKDTVTVTHSRQEESLPSQPADQQFLFEWQLHITLNKEITEITSTTLKIVNLQFRETTSPQFKEELNRKLCSGNLFVY